MREEPITGKEVQVTVVTSLKTEETKDEGRNVEKRDLDYDNGGRYTWHTNVTRGDLLGPWEGGGVKF